MRYLVPFSRYKGDANQRELNVKRQLKALLKVDQNKRLWDWMLSSLKKIKIRGIVSNAEYDNERDDLDLHDPRESHERRQSATITLSTISIFINYVQCKPINLELQQSS